MLKTKHFHTPVSQFTNHSCTNTNLYLYLTQTEEDT